MAAGICGHSARRALARSGTDFGKGLVVQSVFQFLPKAFRVLEVMNLCRSLEFFDSNIGKSYPYCSSVLVSRDFVMEEPVWAS